MASVAFGSGESIINNNNIIKTCWMKNLLLTVLCCVVGYVVCEAQECQRYTLPEGKEIYIPEELRDNDFTNKDSQWSYYRMACTPNVVCFWEKGFGDDLSKAPDLDGQSMTVDLDNLLARVEYFYNVYRDMMGFLLPGSKAEKYRMMVMLKYSLEGTDARLGCHAAYVEMHLPLKLIAQVGEVALSLYAQALVSGGYLDVGELHAVGITVEGALHLQRCREVLQHGGKRLGDVAQLGGDTEVGGMVRD